MVDASKKEIFLTAFCCLIGCTEKKALEVYERKSSDNSYIDAIIEEFRRNAQEGFFND